MYESKRSETYSVFITDDDINHIMRVFLNSRFIVWCNHIELNGKIFDKDAIKYIDANDCFIIHTKEPYNSKNTFCLNKEKIISGIKATLDDEYIPRWFELDGAKKLKIRKSEIDEINVDIFIQLALWGRIVFP